MSQKDLGEASLDIVWEALKAILGGLFGGATATAAQNGGYNFITTGVIGLIIVSAVVSFLVVGLIRWTVKTDREILST
jgi:FtsH-binding integral membrane protein